MRDLLAAADGRVEMLDRMQWATTSALMALIANVNTAANARAFQPDDFNPYQKQITRRRGTKINGKNIDLLIGAFVPNYKPEKNPKS